MSTLDATMSMLEAMPEAARIKVFKYTQGLFTAEKPATPFVPKTREDVLKDLEISEDQVAKGKVRDMREALKDLRNRHGFI